MKKLLYGLIIIAAFGSFAISCIDKAKFADVEAMQDRYIVYSLNDSIDINQAMAFLKASNFKVQKKLKHINGFTAMINKGMADELAKAEGLIVEKDTEASIDFLIGCETKKPVQEPPTTQPKQEIGWGAIALNAQAAWTKSKGKGVVVCTVDTGIDKDHPDLEGAIEGGEDFTGKGDWQDDNGHGSHVAGIIAARDNDIGIVGIAPEAKVWANKALSASGVGWNSDVADAVAGCVASGSQIINMSLGSPEESKILSAEIIMAHDQGIFVVAAAGNETSPVSFPAKLQETIAVSAVDKDLQRAFFTNFGPEISFAAPGVGIISTIPSKGYMALDGTSMASPHVAGVLALMISAQKTEPMAKDIGLDPIFQGEGLIDAFATVQ